MRFRCCGHRASRGDSGKVVVRPFDVKPFTPEPIPTRIVCICETLDEAREAFDGWRYCLPRQLGDDLKIVETWV